MASDLPIQVLCSACGEPREAGHICLEILKSPEQRERDRLRAAVEWVLAHGQVGKQSERRLKEALRV
jgi:hypothetical protein